MRRLALALLLTTSLVAACDRQSPAAETPAGLSAQAEAVARTLAQATPTASPPPTAPSTQNASPDLALVRLQILLDRSSFSPGLIDGLDGQNLRQAAAAWRAAHDLPGGDVLDADLAQRLAAADNGAATATYQVTAADMAGPFSPPPGEDLKAQAANGVNYSSALERLAERFHVSEQLLMALNPGLDLRQGAVLLVPELSSAPLPAVARIEVDKGARALRAYDEADRLVAYYPATIGSSDNPTPSGDLKVNGVARQPGYTYDPAKLSYGPGGDKVVVPAGPNNPVGAVWIDLSRESYGIHGTPDPAKVGKTASHGCVRLTNWDVRRLSEAVKPGVAVRFT